MVVAATDLDRLRAAISGALVQPGSDGYDEHRRSFNAMLDRHPAAVVACESAADVVAALAFARDHGLQLGIRGGGHSVAGHGVVDGGLIIDLRRMRRVDVDPDVYLARAQGGATWLEMDTATQAHGLAVAGGTFVDTGVAGLALGGGIGFLMGVSGLTCDNIVGAELITADGEIREVDERSDPDLLWALRGGGGNFGVATRLDFRLVPVGAVFGGWFLVGLDDGRILERLAVAQRDAPDEYVALAYAANRPELGPSLSIQVCSLAGEATTRTRIDETLGDVRRIDVKREMGWLTYAEVQGFAGIMPPTLRHYWKSAFAPDLGRTAADVVVESVQSRATGKSGVLLEPIHGAARRSGFDHSPFPQREARWHVSGLGIWEHAAEDEREMAWVRTLNAGISAVGTTGTYVNYSAHDEPANRASSTWPPEVLARLRAVKRRVDPENTFRSNLNIAP